VTLSLDFHSRLISVTIPRMKATNIKVTRDEKAWEAVIEADIPAAVLESQSATALKNLQREAHLDGFRPGKAPINLVRARVGEAAILREAAELAVRDELPEILAKESLPIVDVPQVMTAQPEAGKDLHFTARAPMAPEIKLPDYASIAARINADKKPAVVSDDEHAETLTHFRRERARVEKLEAGVDPKEAAEASKTLAAADLPTLDDAFVKPFGYESVAAFETAVRENLQHEKELRAQQEIRTKILDAIIKESSVQYPAILREYELDEMEARLSDDLAQMGATFEKYLAETNKTREAVRGEWNDAADTRAKTRLVLAEIARTEKIEADTGDVDQQLAYATKHYPQANPDVMRTNITHSLRNEKVFEWLESKR
jgi:trigger factor